MSNQLRQSLQGMLESYDMLIAEANRTNEAWAGTIRGFFVGEIARAREALAETSDVDVNALLAENRRLRDALSVQQETKPLTPFARMVFEHLPPTPPIHSAPAIPRPYGRVIDVPNQEEALARQVDGLNGPFSVRAARCLNEMGVRTVAELVKRPATELIEHQQFGQKCLEEVREWLNHYGLKLAGDPDVYVPPKKKSKKRKKN